MFKLNNSLRLKSIFLDLSLLCGIGVLTSTLYFIYYRKFDHLYYYNFEMSLLYSLFFCKDLFGSQSIGKRVFKLKVINTKITKDQDKVDTLGLSSIRSILRNLFIYIWPIEIILLLSENKRLGDLIINSKVIPFNKQAERIKKIDILKNMFIFILVFAIILLFTFSALSLLK